MFGLPILGWILNVISMKFYILDKEKMVEVQKTLAERKKRGRGHGSGGGEGVVRRSVKVQMLRLSVWRKAGQAGSLFFAGNGVL